MPDEPRFRYLLKGVNGASFSESELIKSKEKYAKTKIKKVLDKRKVKNRLEYLVWFEGDLKKDAVWLPNKQLKEDGVNASKLLDG